MEPFGIKHYVGDERPTLKGNGFDGLEVGEDREEAVEFVGWLNTEIVAKWRCFHCDESFTDPTEATLHFGRSERQHPICQIDVVEYRAMELRMHRYNEEDADIHRQMYHLQGEHQLALQRAEELGYARGLRDAVRFPEEALHDELIDASAEAIGLAYAGRDGDFRRLVRKVFTG